MENLVLCRPRGGFNDMLVQIEKCYRYAEKENRKLVVDGTRSGFLDRLDNYFVSDLMSFESDIPDGDLDCFPSLPSSDGLNYRARYNKKIKNFAFDGTSEQISFDFSKSYSNKILLHEQCGGGKISIKALSRLNLSSDLANKILNVVESLGVYEAIHVRNTDYKTDYIGFFNSLTFQEEKIVLCSDDYDCQEYAMSLWGDRLIIPNVAPVTNGKPLHMNISLNRLEINTAALSDLVILACAKKLHYTEVDKGKISGFTLLSKMLNENRQVLNFFVKGDL